jgi:hypothetical protein
MRPFIVFYLWLLAPIFFLTVMLYAAIKPGAANRAGTGNRGQHRPVRHV